MNSIKILLRLSRGESELYSYRRPPLNETCHHNWVDNTCINCFYTKDTHQPLIYLREKEFEDANIRL